MSKFILLYRSLLLLFFCCYIISSSFGQYQLNGSARKDTGTCFVLTNDTIQSASVWYLDQVDISESFDLNFKIFLGCNDAEGADGMAFVLQQVSTNVGSFGQGIGYFNIAPSLAVEIDTWQNADNNDPAYDHLSIQRNGVLEHGTPQNLAGPVPALADAGNIEDCEEHKLRVTWKPDSLLLKVYVDCELRISYTGDIINDIFNGDGNVYWGFTGATGGFANKQYFCLDYVSFLQQEQDITVCQNDSVQIDVGEGLSFNWSPSRFVSDPTIQNPIIKPATDITYQVEVMNTCGQDLRQVSVNVNIIDEPNVGISPDTLTCGGIPVQLQATGGDSYRWRPSAGLSDTTIANPLASPLIASVYEVTITSNATGCSALRTISVDALYVDAGEDQSICLGDSVSLQAKGADSYTWNNAPGLSALDVANPNASPPLNIDYIVAGSNANNSCTDLDTVRILVNNKPEVTIIPSAPSLCSGDTISLQASGNFNYRWTGDPSIISDLSSSVVDISTIFNPQGGNVKPFILSTTDQATNCVSVDTFKLSIIQLPDIDAGGNRDLCEGETINLQATGGLSYNWNPAIGLSNPSIANPTLTADQSAFYTVTGTDSNGCSNVSRIRINVEPKPEARGQDIYEICEGQGATIRVSGADSYLWSNGAISPEISVSPSQNTEYFVIPFSNTGCIGDTFNVQVDVNNLKPIASFNPTLTEGFAPSIIDFINLSRFSDTYEWNFGDESEVSTAFNPFHIYEKPGNFRVSLIAYDQARVCPDTAYYEFIKIKDYLLHIPTAFSPNQDGINDLFYVETIAIQAFLLQIFDQWGNKVFETTDTEFSWDGSYEGKALPEGVYMYALRAISNGVKRIDEQGTISLVR